MFRFDKFGRKTSLGGDVYLVGVTCARLHGALVFRAVQIHVVARDGYGFDGGVDKSENAK